MNNMKKMMIVLMMVFTMIAGLFAYEPKKENVTVKGNKARYEEIYKENCISTIKRLWTYNTKSGKFIYYTCSSFDDMWDYLFGCRERYYIYLNAAKYKDDTCSTCAFLEKYKSAYENNELNEVEMKQYESIVKLHGSASELKGAIEGKPTHAKTDTKSYYELCANEQKMKSVNEIPFVTEENWKTITKEELLDKIHAFIEEVKAVNK